MSVSKPLGRIESVMTGRGSKYHVVFHLAPSATVSIRHGRSSSRENPKGTRYAEFKMQRVVTPSCDTNLK